MPIRFQVDGDFYDHPKTTGMSDAAFSLWVRAGSFSAAKTTDGFVAEDVLVHTLRSEMEVAAELVRRGLWRRVRGGFQYHQWEQRNLTKTRIEADREADRIRKRATRNAGTLSGNPQVNSHLVRPDSGGIPNGVQGESDGIPGVSVSVSVSESVSGSGHGPLAPANGRASPPPNRCEQHQQRPTTEPCRACGDARQTHETWQAQRRARLDQAPHCPRHRGQPANNCGLCRSEELSSA